MAFYSLPILAESKFASYITANYSGAYNVVQAFTVQDYQLPMIKVAAGKFKEIEPGTNVYEGELAVGILTQIDDVTDPLGTHDVTVATVYNLLANQTALLSGVSNTDGTFTVWGMYNDGYEQERIDRALVSILSFKINCQTLGV